MHEACTRHAQGAASLWLATRAGPSPSGRTAVSGTGGGPAGRQRAQTMGRRNQPASGGGEAHGGKRLAGAAKPAPDEG